MRCRITVANRYSEKITIDFHLDLTKMWVSGLSKTYRVFQLDDAYDFAGGPLLRRSFKVADMLGQFRDISIDVEIWRILVALTAENIELSENTLGLVAKFDLSIGDYSPEFKKIK